jgi:hypothetical protein
VAACNFNTRNTAPDLGHAAHQACGHNRRTAAKRVETLICRMAG